MSLLSISATAFVPPPIIFTFHTPSSSRNALFITPSNASPLSFVLLPSCFFTTFFLLSSRSIFKASVGSIPIAFVAAFIRFISIPLKFVSPVFWSMVPIPLNILWILFAYAAGSFHASYCMAIGSAPIANLPPRTCSLAACVTAPSSPSSCALSIIPPRLPKLNLTFSDHFASSIKPLTPFLKENFSANFMFDNTDFVSFCWDSPILLALLYISYIISAELETDLLNRFISDENWTKLSSPTNLPTAILFS